MERGVCVGGGGCYYTDEGQLDIIEPYSCHDEMRNWGQGVGGERAKGPKLFFHSS